MPAWRLLAAAGLIPAAAVSAAGEAQTVPVVALEAAPVVDGQLGDWPDSAWIDVPIKPAVDKDDRNRTGEIVVRLATGVADGKIFIAARWSDDSANSDYKNWEWAGSKYRRGKDVEDMFVVRFDMEGDYDSCMLTDKEYQVDVWLWSAARTNPAGYANDMWQLITTKMMERAAEYEGPDGKIVYIRKSADDGEPIYTNTRPDRKTFAGDTLPGVEMTGAQSGSVADVRAQGVWADGHWQLEMSRDLSTGHADDVALDQVATKLGAIGAFNRAASEHKSVSGDLQFDFSALR